jgi:protocatechuate 4,5-dioxygenase alpha chain
MLMDGTGASADNTHMCNGVLSFAAAVPGSRPLGGQSINQLCRTLADPQGRRQFLLDEEACCLRFGLDKEARQAVRNRDFVRLIQLGAHVIHLNELAALAGLSTLEAIRMCTDASGHMVIDKLLRTDTP